MESAAYGLELQARAIAPIQNQGGDFSCHRFVVGTASAKANNKIHLLEYRESTNMVDCVAVWNHDNEIWRLSASPSQTSALLASVHTSPTDVSEKACTVFSLGGESETELSMVQKFQGNISNFLWDPQGVQHSVVAIVGSGVCWFKLEAPQTPVTSVPLVGAQRIFGAAWDPHHSDVVAVGVDTSIVVVDGRTKKTNLCTDSAHGLSVRSLDFNPNKIHHLVSGGDDGYIRFWDLRKGNEAVASVFAHDHWVHQVSFNPTNDHLLLSAGSDHCCKMWQFVEQSSIASSRPQGNAAELGKDGIVRNVTDFGESVYSACWSGSTPWVFAACSYNGKILIDKVPAAIQRMSRMRET